MTQDLIWKKRTDKSGYTQEYIEINYKGYSAEIKKDGNYVDYRTDFAPKGYNGSFYRSSALNAEVAAQIIKNMIDEIVG